MQGLAKPDEQDNEQESGYTQKTENEVILNTSIALATFIHYPYR
jgi:hypothetical protein